MQRLVIAACVIIAVVFSFTTVADGQDKSNGEIQLERLLADRPDMRGIFPKDDVVLRWVIRSFEFGRLCGTTASQLTEWLSTLPRAKHWFV